MSRSGAIIVLGTFATIWWMVGAAQVGRGSVLLCAIGLVTSGLLVALGWRRAGRSASREERRRRGRIIGIASGIEGAAILAAVIALGKFGRRDLMAPAVAIIVGLHFLPIARWLPAPIYYLTAVLLIAVGMAGAAVDDLSTRILTVSFGAATVLWLSCGIVLFAADRQRPWRNGPVRR